MWSFNIEGEKLESANGAKTPLANTKVLAPLGEKPSEFLLEAKGIAVDPTTNDVIILGEEALVNDPKATGIAAFERITETGTLAEARWSDTTTEEDPEGLLEDEAYSPVVTKNGEVLVADTATSQIDKIPTIFHDMASLHPSMKPTRRSKKKACWKKGPVVEHLTSFTDTISELRGGGSLSLGSDGTLYALADIQEQQHANGTYYPGALLFSSNAGAQKEWSEEGWTGGQSKEGPCKIPNGVDTQIAAGTEHHLFVFDESPTSPRIVEFGPVGGKGCPKGSVSAPAASTVSSDGKPIAEDEPIPLKDSVTFSSNLVESNALSVEWEFGDGTTQTVSTDEHQTTSVEHKFAKIGTYEVTEKIHTDDLANRDSPRTAKCTSSLRSPLWKRPKKSRKRALRWRGRSTRKARKLRNARSNTGRLCRRAKPPPVRPCPVPASPLWPCRRRSRGWLLARHTTSSSPRLTSTARKARPRRSRPRRQRRGRRSQRKRRKR